MALVRIAMLTTSKYNVWVFHRCCRMSHHLDHMGVTAQRKSQHLKVIKKTETNICSLQQAKSCKNAYEIDHEIYQSHTKTRQTLYAWTPGQ